jgi:Met-zincin/Domain of unknown function (DUF5117)/Domain of unknown function (DUF5118)
MLLKEYNQQQMNQFKIFILSFWLFTITSSLHAQTTINLPQIDKFIKTNAVVHKGMFNVYVQDEKYFMEIPRQSLGREILATITINNGSAQIERDPEKRFGFSGDAVYDIVFSLKQYKDKKILLERPVFYNLPDSSSSYFEQFKSKRFPISLTFNIVAASTNSVLFDFTEAFLSDLPIFSLSGAKEDLSLGGYQSGLSYPLSVSAYPNNIVFRSVKAYSAGSSTSAKKTNASPAGLPAKPEEQKTTGPTVWEVGSCWYLLPEIPMKQRIADERVGYFTKVVKDYATDPNGFKELPLATRWRLEPKPEDMEKYKRGELVEPIKPIVYYIDKNTPEYLKPYFIAGVNAWQKSFEKIGFKNAIMAKPEPTLAEDPDFAIDNINYSIISYKPSLTPNAYGPSVIDPRSGEILNTHVAVFHNILDLLQRWYFVMCSTVDPRAQSLPLSPEIMGTLAQRVITHEVGHTLGLRHNFAGSSTYPIDSIRNKKFIDKNSYGASIMDYMRFNYVAQPEDHLSPAELLPRVSVYDDYAIEWGYKITDFSTDRVKEKQYLRSWVSEKRKDPRFFYLEEKDFSDPRVQSEDMGNNAIEASTLGIKNLQIMMENLDTWIGKSDDLNYAMLRKMHTAIVSRYNQYLEHVLKNIGGRYGDKSLIAENKPNYIPVERAKQKEAMNFLKTYYFQEPEWLFPESVSSKTKFLFNGMVSADYETFFGKLFYKFSALSYNERIVGPKPYTVKEFFDDLYENLYAEVDKGNPISSYQRLLQRAYVNKILASVTIPPSFESDVALLLKIQIEKIANVCEAGARKNKDVASKQHLKAIVEIIHQWMNPKSAISPSNNTK